MPERLWTPPRYTEAAAIALYEAWHAVHQRPPAPWTRATMRGSAPVTPLKPTIDRFFDEVLVSEHEPAERERRSTLPSCRC